jgi:L-cysteine/cystine lyase
MTLDEIRAEFPVLDRLAYLNAGTFGPLPRRSADAITEWTRRSLEEGRFGHAFFEEVIAMRTRLREELGALIGADASTLAITTSTTEGCNIVVSGLGLGPGDEVVTTDSEHPGLIGGLRTTGAQIREAAIQDLPAADAIEAIEREITPATKLIALSHVIWTTGQVIPVERLAGREIPLLVDGAQAAGAIPVDVGAIDFYTVSGQKWLCGPDATGALYIRPERLEELQLRAPSYFSWASFDWKPQPDARRFEASWTPPGSLAGLLASLDLAAGVGEERFDLARVASERCRELVAERARVVTEPGQATLVSFEPREPAADVVERLSESGVVVRDLPQTGWVRASCGFWTSDEDLERLVAGL